MRNRIYFDNELNIELFLLQNNQQFPSHFHDYYVIGYISDGCRYMRCNNKRYLLSPKDIIVLNPNDSHSCEQINHECFSYFGINISKPAMQDLLSSVVLPHFSSNVINNSKIADTFENLLDKIINKRELFEREEALHLLLSILIKIDTSDFIDDEVDYIHQIECTADFIHSNYQQHISLDELCSIGHMSKSSLIRHFTKIKGVTPYRYLQSVRINQAKLLLEKGIPPIEVSNLVGFSDQSHFTNSFVHFIGLTPANYKNILNRNHYEN